MRSFLLAIQLCGIVLFGGWIESCSGAIPTTEPNFFCRSWQVEQGLPQNKVTAVVQTRDSYLWVGTYSGLARFDGIRFTVFNEKNTPEIHSSRVSALFEADDSTVWIGYENGSVTTCKNGKFQTIDIHTSLAAAKIHNITADAVGDIWLLNENGFLIRVRDGLVLSPKVGPAPRLLNLARSNDGRIWVARDGELSVLENGELQEVPTEEAGTGSYVQGICPSRDGTIWVASSGHLRKWNGEKWISDFAAPPWDMTPLTCFIETKNGTLVAGTSNRGFFLMFPGTDKKSVHSDHVPGFKADWIISLLEDRENNLWIGTGGSGLVSLRENNIQTLSPPDRWRERPVLSTFLARNNDLWIGTEGAGIYRYHDGDWSNFGFTNGIGNSYVWSVAEDGEGKLWVGTWGAGLYFRDGDRFKTGPGTENIKMPVPALLLARDGGLWVGTEAGLLHYQDGRTNWIAGTDGKSLRDVRTIAEDANGTVWFGMAGNGLACLRSNKIRQFTRADGLPSDYIECIHIDDGSLWIGTFGGGLCRLKDGKFSVIDEEQGLPNNVIGHIEDDGRGYFWMSSHGGIIRASKADLTRCADQKTNAVHWLAYDVNDGLPTIECSEGLQPSGGKMADGRLCFPTSKGLVAVDSTAVKINSLPPPMALEEFFVDGRLVTNMTSRLRFSAGSTHFEFNYSGLSFVAPEKVRFKYRIEGLENNWVNAGIKRVANYSFIPPGNYTFRVIACNNDGLYNETGLSLPFTLLPHFWQTWWFRILGGIATAVAAGMIVWFDARRRTRRRFEKLEREQAIERERTRIAKDIHDDLGASLTRITMLSLPSHQKVPVPENIALNLEQIYGTARELTRSMDEIVWAVNPRHDTFDSLASYLSRFALDFLSAANIRCRLDMPLQLPTRPLTVEVRHNLFLVFKEALHNVVKHSGASEVQIALKLHGTTLAVMIKDNGCGFLLNDPRRDLNAAPDRIETGNGLINMKRRMTEISGECEIQSAPGSGTSLTLSVPVAPDAK